MTVSGIDRTEVTPRAPSRWYRSKTFLLGLFGFLSSFWFWADSVQMTTMLLVGSKRVPGYVSVQTYHGSIGFLIQTHLLRGYGLLWLGVLWWRWRKLRARG